jgi:hypothetical protein
MTHTVTALKIEKSREGLTISALSQSPRGTKYIVKSVTVDTGSEDKKERQAAIAAALVSVYPGS